MSMAFDLLKRFPLFTILVFFSLLINFSSCLNEELFNISSIGDSFEHAVATWYGPPEGPGSGGGCGFENDVAGSPYNGMISAGNQALYKSGFGCGSCYQVKCTVSAYCSGSPITVTLTDECPGLCNNDPVHFDLSGIAFGAMAKPGQGGSLRQLGRIDVAYQRVPCNYPGTHITFKIDSGSNPYYFATAIEYVAQDGTIGSVDVQPAGSNQWLPMQHSWGATWKFDVYPGKTDPPFSIRITTAESKRVVIAENVIPVNWAPGKYYASHYAT